MGQYARRSLVPSLSPHPTLEKDGDISKVILSHFYNIILIFEFRFFDEYAKYNITFWAFSSQNEPVTALFISREDFPCNYFSPQHQRDFIIQDLGPALAASRHADIRLMILDDGRCHLPNWADQVGFQG